MNNTTTPKKPDILPKVSLDDVEITAWRRNFSFEYNGVKFSGSFSYDFGDNEHTFLIDVVYSSDPYKDIPEEVQDAIEEYVRNFEGNQEEE